MKKAVLKISQNSQENTCVRVSILIKCKLRTPLEGVKNTFFTDRHWATASVIPYTIMYHKP